ncbi:MAG: hypothetical protein EBU34_14420, partial [Alphaproteobacteria bacterium]|nr:hypothetical protein [Alphaproteobacteria bacterium]
NTQYKFSSDYDYFYRMIVHHKLRGISTKKHELVGTFRRGGFSSKVVFFDHFMEQKFHFDLKLTQKRLCRL